MKQIQLKDVQENFEQIFEDVLVSGEPAEIQKEAGNAILVSEDIWRGMIETLNLLSIPGTPRGIRTHLGLNKPIYQRTAAYGHFGRAPDADGGFSWERTDLIDALKAAV